MATGQVIWWQPKMECSEKEWSGACTYSVLPPIISEPEVAVHTATSCFSDQERSQTAPLRKDLWKGDTFFRLVFPQFGLAPEWPEALLQMCLFGWASCEQSEATLELVQMTYLTRRRVSLSNFSFKYWLVSRNQSEGYALWHAWAWLMVQS